MVWSCFIVCNVNCHKKCEKHMPNLCGVNQRLLAEALHQVKKYPSNMKRPSKMQDQTVSTDSYTILMQGCQWSGKSQGNSRSGKSQGILELVREIWKFFESQGNFKKGREI